MKRKDAELLRLCELNNLKSPDILSATLMAHTKFEASEIVAIFEETTGEEVPFAQDNWLRTVTLPVGLYFVFKRKRDLSAFAKMVRKKFPEMEVIM